MDKALSHQEETIEAILENQQIIPRNPNPPSAFSFLVSKSVKFLRNRAKLPNRVSSKRFDFDGMIVNNFVYSDIEAKMEGEKDGLSKSEGKFGNLVDLNGESSPSSDFLASEVTLNYENSSSEDSLSTPEMGWTMQKDKVPHCVDSEVSQEVEKAHFEKGKLEKEGSSLSEFEMMKERFSKLLLGEDMSGCGNGVSTALAISNAITNLCATLFGQIWRLEPLKPEKKLMWRREMEWLLSVSDHVVELIPSWQTFPDGTKLEVMTSRPRLDLFINLPALRKLDNMLLEILDSFETCEFWYVDQGIIAPEANGSSSFQNPLPHQEDKWWLPVPRVPPGGLSENARKFLQHKRDCANQILKAAMAINSAALAEMDVPNSYIEALPKNGKMSLGDLIHRYMSSDQFTPECLLDFLDLSSDHHAVEIANRVEAAIYVWRRKMGSKPLHSMVRENSKTSWEMVKDMVSDVEKRELLADRAESLLLCLKHRFPGLPQTTLDMTKIQYNKDVGKSILESYSRVLESLSFNIVARIDDLIYVDDLSKHSDKLVSISKVGVVAQKTSTLSPLKLISNAKGDRLPYMDISKNNSLRRFGLDRILNDYLSLDGKLKGNTNGFGSFSSSSRKVHSPSRNESVEDE